MTDGDPREQLRGQNLATHLNERHPDTVLFLARHAAGHVAAVAAALVGLDGDEGAALSIDDGTTTHLVQLPLPAGADLRTRLGALLRQTRAAAPPGPLTSLEQQHAG